MNVNRNALIRHLAKVACNGQIEGAVFSGAFQTAALSPDQLMLVIAPDLDGLDEALPKELGLPWLDTFSKALRVLASGEDAPADVSVKVEGHHLVIDEGERGALKLVVAAPKTIGTHLPADIVEKLVAAAPQSGEGIPLTAHLVGSVRETFALFKATEVEVFVGPDGGKIRVGNENGNVAEFASVSLVAEEAFSLLFGRHFVDALSVVNDHANAVLLLGDGPEKSVVVEDGAYRYILAPRSRGADA